MGPTIDQSLFIPGSIENFTNHQHEIVPLDKISEKLSKKIKTDEIEKLDIENDVRQNIRF